MYVDNTSASAWTQHSAAGTNHRVGVSASEGSLASRKSDEHAGDSVVISQLARDLASAMSSVTAIQPIDGFSLATTNATAATNAGLRKYTNVGLGDGSTNLTAMNYSRKQLSGRIDIALKKAGIELKSDEKLAISVNSKNEIVVGGIKDKAKAKKIQEALNNDKKLATEMRNHVAAGKINENEAKRQQYLEYLESTGQPVPEDIDDKFTSPAIRNYVIDEYLGENAGLRLSDLSLGYDEEGNASIVGGDDSFQALLNMDHQLGVTIGKILESGETSAEFNVSFEFANGAISDPHSKAMAESKVQGIRDKLFNLGLNPKKPPHEPGKLGVADEFREFVERNGGFEEEALQKALERGFSIRVKSSGAYEIAGLDDLDPKYRDTLRSLVDKAIDQWVESVPDAYDGGGKRVGNLADVYDAFMEDHKFEHGDTEEHLHEVEIALGDGGDTKVVSPEADKAQHGKNQQLAGELGESLRKNMADNGIDVASLELEINQSGKITVKGGASDAELKKAQDFVNQFIRDAKLGGLTDEEKEEDKKARIAAEGERREIHQGKDEDKPTAANVVAWAHGRGEDQAPEVDEGSMTVEELRQKQKNEAWAKYFPDSFDGVFYLGRSKGVSDVKANQYQDTGGDDAANLYRRLVNGLDKFHDKPNSFSYAM